jgi:hypothetical protein
MRHKSNKHGDEQAMKARPAFHHFRCLSLHCVQDMVSNLEFYIPQICPALRVQRHLLRPRYLQYHDAAGTLRHGNVCIAVSSIGGADIAFLGLFNGSGRAMPKGTIVCEYGGFVCDRCALTAKTWTHGMNDAGTHARQLPGYTHCVKDGKLWAKQFSAPPPHAADELVGGDGGKTSKPVATVTATATSTTSIAATSTIRTSMRQADAYKCHQKKLPIQQRLRFVPNGASAALNELMSVAGVGYMANAGSSKECNVKIITLSPRCDFAGPPAIFYVATRLIPACGEILVRYNNREF